METRLAGKRSSGRMALRRGRGRRISCPSLFLRSTVMQLLLRCVRLEQTLRSQALAGPRRPISSANAGRSAMTIAGPASPSIMLRWGMVRFRERSRTFVPSKPCGMKPPTGRGWERGAKGQCSYLLVSRPSALRYHRLMLEYFRQGLTSDLFSRTSRHWLMHFRVSWGMMTSSR